MNDRKIPVIIDCDPGTDDIFALMLARKLRELDVRAVTAVAGNVELEHTSMNALKTTALLKWDVPVCKGADKPLCCELVTAANVHGKNGMHGLELPDTDKSFDELSAWDMMYREAKLANGELVIIAVGPLTNVAIAINKYPEMKTLVNRIVIMGGTVLAGNTTPATEFNIFVDPEAAQMVLLSGIPVYVCPLDVTHKAYITPKEVQKIRALGSEQARFLADVTDRGFPFVGKYADGKGSPLHDPCAVLFAADEALFTYERCSMLVETKGLITRGMTITDQWSDKQLGLNNAYLVYDVDREAFFDRVYGLMAQY